MAITGIGLVVCGTDLGSECADEMEQEDALDYSHPSSVGRRRDIPLQ